MQVTSIGLGLAIARQVAATHRGDLSVTDGDLPGAHLVLLLPS